MNLSAPLQLYSTTVLPEWIDYNQHMMDGFYTIPFSHASDAFMEYVGMDAAYRARTGCTIYTAEGHVCFLREMKVGAGIRIETQLLGFDAKRVHLFHSMINTEQGYLAATCEWMLIHVDPAIGKGVAMAGEVIGRLTAVYASHQQLPLPTQSGRSVNMQKKNQSK